MYKVDCVILAAGNSTRMGCDLNKQFLDVGNKPVIWYSIDAFCKHKYVDRVILVLNSSYIDYCLENVIKHYGFSEEKIKIVIGGETRQQSLSNALKHVKTKYVMVHDGARPFINSNLITEGIRLAYIYGASSCYIKPKDTIRVVCERGTKLLDRDKLMCVQTPQCFDLAILNEAYRYVEENNKVITDETSALDFIEYETHFYLGSYFNIKITTKEDLCFGEEILKMNLV